MNNENYIIIQGWMINELNLKGNELLVYSIIYGFSQDNESAFTGSRQYLADWCNSTVRSIQIVLNSLVEKGYITKSENIQNGVKFCSYVANFTGGEKSSRGSEKSSLNNIVNNKNDILSKDNISSEPLSNDTFQFGEVKPKKPNLYQKCVQLIDDWTNIDSIHKLLVQYLDLCMEMQSIRGANQWKGMLNTLERVQKECHPHTFEEIISMSIDHGWKTFYPIKDTSYNNTKGRGKNLEGFIAPDIANDGLNHTKSEREF